VQDLPQSSDVACSWPVVPLLPYRRYGFVLVRKRGRHHANIPGKGEDTESLIRDHAGRSRLNQIFHRRTNRARAVRSRGLCVASHPHRLRVASVPFFRPSSLCVHRTGEDVFQFAISPITQTWDRNEEDDRANFDRIWAHWAAERERCDRQRK
jgi:hypothetical protein